MHLKCHLVHTFPTLFYSTILCACMIFVRTVVRWISFQNCVALVGHYFLGTFTKLWKATISFVMSVCLSIHMEQLSSHWTDIHEICYLRIFWKSVKKIPVSLKSDKSNLCKDQYTFLTIPCSFLLRMRNVSDKSCRENQNTHFVFSNFYSKIMLFMR
jgi:hypothetical protein